jgi:hypothetical protein
VDTATPGSYVLTYAASDGQQTGTVTRTINVVDTTPPQVTLHFQSLSLSASSTNCAALVPDTTGPGYIELSDNSGSASVSQVPPRGTVLPLGRTDLVLIATDPAGNITSITNTIVVLDETLPELLTQPESCTNSPGESATLSLVASACSPLSYQWWFNGQRLSGQTASSLSLQNIECSNAGSYFVEVTTTAGSVTSAVAVVTVNLVPPALAGQQMLSNGSFQITFGGPLGQPYRLLATSDLAIPIQNWTVLTNATFGSSPTVFSDAEATSLPSRFYRVVSP